MSVRKINFIWLLLIAATIFSWLAIESRVSIFQNIELYNVFLIVALITAVKTFFVIMYYMEIIYAPMFLKFILLVWVTFTTMSIVLIYTKPNWMILIMNFV